MAQAVAWFSGFETGDTSEMNTIGSGTSVQSSVFRSGVYALKCATILSRTNATNFLNATQAVIRFYFRYSALPAANLLFFQPRGNTGTTGDYARVQLATTGVLRITDTNSNLGFSATLGNTVLAANTWYRICMAIDLAANGVIKIWVNGVLDINITHTTNASGTPVNYFNLQGDANPNEYFFDDVRIDTGGVAEIGDGKIIARSPSTGNTPTYDAWTKSSGSDAAALWNETPFSATKNCSSSTSAAAQTATIAAFSATQSGHGTEAISAGATVNACKVGLIIKRSTSGNPFIRRRVNGSDTDTVTSGVTASDSYKEDGPWTTTVANLDLLEAGAKKAADGNSTTVEDVWVMVDYTPISNTASLGVGTFTLTGNSLTAPVSHPAALGVGTFTLTGIGMVPHLTYGAQLGVASFTFTARAMTFPAARIASVDIATFDFTAFDLEIGTTKGISLDAADFAVTGYTLGRTFLRTLGTGAFVLTGKDISPVSNPRHVDIPLVVNAYFVNGLEVGEGKLLVRFIKDFKHAAAKPAKRPAQLDKFRGAAEALANLRTGE